MRPRYMSIKSLRQLKTDIKIITAEIQQLNSKPIFFSLNLKPYVILEKNTQIRF